MLDASSPLANTLAPAGEAKNAFALKRLRRAIVACELWPGHAVSEREIAERYGLGRAATRVALTTLVAEGFVTPKARHGWRIRPVSGALVGDVLAARRALEPALATLQLVATDAAALRGSLNLVAALRERGDRQSLVTARAAERQVMDHLAARAGGFLAHWLGELWNHVDRIAACFDAESGHFHAADRAALVDALARGSTAAARAEIMREIDRFQVFVTDRLLRDPAVLAKPAGRSTGAVPRAARRGRDKRASALHEGRKPS